MKKFKIFVDKRFEKLAGYLKSYHHIQNPELLHLIRVEVKKIKVAFGLIGYAVHEFNAHQHFIPIRTVFRRAGEIRELDVFYRLLLRYQIAGVTDDQIPNADKVNAMCAAFQRDVPLFLKLIKTEKKKLSKYYHKVKKTNVQAYVKERRKEIKRLLFPRLVKAKLHNVRKLAKEIIYLNRLKGDRKVNTFYTDVDTIIGQWHDKQLLLPVLEKRHATDDSIRLTRLSNADLTSLKEKTVHYFGN